MLSAYVADLFKRSAGHGTYTRRGLWAHLLGTAAVARLIAQNCGKVPPQEAYLAGLLHDFGLILIDQYLHGPFCRVVDALDTETGLCEVERNVFVESSRINSTWGGNLTDMVRSQAYLEIIQEENLVENARERGKTLLAGLHDLETRHAGVTQARGRGLMAAFDVSTPELRGKILEKGRERGVLALPSGYRSIRFRPSLNITDAEITRALEVLDKAIGDAL